MNKFLLMTQGSGQRVAVNVDRILSIAPAHESRQELYKSVVTIETGGQDWYGVQETFDELITALNKS